MKRKKKACTVLVSNGRYGGSGIRPTPNADRSDRLFDVLIVGDVAKPELLQFLPRVYRSTQLTHTKVTIRRATKVEIHALKPIAVGG